MPTKKNKADKGGFVYSTDPNFRFDREQSHTETPTPAEQKLRVRLDTKQRSGKAVTLIEGFTGTSEDCENLGRQLRTFCGTGGSVKEGNIIVQGDQREKVIGWLMKHGFTASKKL